MIENVNLWENPFLVISFSVVLFGIGVWLAQWFDILCHRRIRLDERKLFKERHDASYSPLEKLHLMEVKQ